jgi:hypothetical protein
VKLKELGKLMDQVAPSEPVNIRLDERKPVWAVPFQGVFIGLSFCSQVPELQCLDRMELVEGKLVLVFEDGSQLEESYAFCVGTLEEVKASYPKPAGNPVNLAERFGEVVQGLDWPKYQRILQARKAVKEAQSAYQRVVLEQGVVVNYKNDDPYDQTLVFRGEGLPTWYE